MRYVKLSVLTVGQAHWFYLSCRRDIFCFSQHHSPVIITLIESLCQLLCQLTPVVPPACTELVFLWECRDGHPVNNHTTLQLAPQYSGIAKGSEIIQKWQHGGAPWGGDSLSHKDFTCKFSFEIRRTSLSGPEAERYQEGQNRIHKTFWQYQSIQRPEECPQLKGTFQLTQKVRGLEIARKSPTDSFKRAKRTRKGLGTLSSLRQCGACCLNCIAGSMLILLKTFDMYPLLSRCYICVSHTTI